MDIELREYTIGEVSSGYMEQGDEGVTSMDGRLNIRPAYQREFVYDNDKRDAVMDTIIKGYPLNVMYWMDLGDDRYEVLDGQQRTISFCRYVSGLFSINERNFTNLTVPERDRILDYKLMIYVCRGDDEERLNWFRTINIAGEKLWDQELRNAVYSGPWVHDAKRYFSRNGAVAQKVAGDYLSGQMKRQDYLETAISWIADAEGTTIEGYMSKHQHDPDASDLWSYFQSVITWVRAKFPVYRKEMKGIKWGLLYNRFHEDTTLDSAKLEEEVSRLMADDEVGNKKGIYTYVLTRELKNLSLRSFTDSEKRTMYERQEGICPRCRDEGRPKTAYSIDEMEADHITPWIEGGRTTLDNGVMLCRFHNRSKGSR